MVSAWRNCDFAGKSVIVILFFLSFYSWYLIIFKFFLLKEVDRKNKIFGDLLLSGKKNPEFINCPLSRIMKYGMKIAKSKNPENIESYIEKAYLKEQGILEKNLSFLATVAAISPFLGLLGTVWGLLVAFHNMAITGSSSIKVVASGVAEALVTTIIGLVVAIPAAVGYNYLREKIAGINERMEFLFPYVKEFILKRKEDEE